MLSKDDFTQYKHQSYFLKLKELVRSKSVGILEYKMIFFGGTGAVGGQAVIEIITSFHFMRDALTESSDRTPQLIITGINGSQIDQFCNKLFQIFGEDNFKKIKKSGDETTLLYDQFITLHFKTLIAIPKFQTDLEKALSKIDKKRDKIDYLISEASKTSSPFEAFVQKVKQELGLSNHEKFQAVFSGIPVPSVATYHFESIDQLLSNHDIAREDTDKKIERAIKKEILKGLAEDFGDIKKYHAHEVLMAHTTSVGGMYQMIDGEPVIKLGYAHSSLGDLLKEKQYYANELTIQYSNFNLKSLVTASAIGIDYIYESSTLPLSSGVSRKYRQAAEKKQLPFDLSIVYDEKGERLLNKLFPIAPILFENNADSTLKIPLNFGGKQDSIPNLNVNYALRSGENGLFSLDNAYALYLNMKIASQEELAHVLVSNALLGDDEQKPWFDKHGICYYTQTDNSSLIFALLNNRKEFRKYQTSAFTTKAFQELGSSKHQAELHLHGLFILMHKLKQLNDDLIDAHITSNLKIDEVKAFVDSHTPHLTLENIVNYGKDIPALTASFTNLLTIKNPEDLAKFMGYSNKISGCIDVFFKQLHIAVSQTICAITSLGNPIIFRNQEGKDEIFAGPYFAPLDLILETNFTLVEALDSLSGKHQLNREDLINWLVCNNGFIDLRPEAVFNTAKTYNTGLENHIHIHYDAQSFREQAKDIQLKNRKNIGENFHFNSSGLLAYCGRITGLFEQLELFDLSLGTYNGWKALFPIDDQFNHILIPGLVEAMRHYSEGLGKITGSEFLYPNYGYFN